MTQMVGSESVSDSQRLGPLWPQARASERDGDQTHSETYLDISIKAQCYMSQVKQRKNSYTSQSLYTRCFAPDDSQVYWREPTVAGIPMTLPHTQSNRRSLSAQRSPRMTLAE